MALPVADAWPSRSGLSQVSFLLPVESLIWNLTFVFLSRCDLFSDQFTHLFLYYWTDTYLDKYQNKQTSTGTITVTGKPLGGMFKYT